MPKACFREDTLKSVFLMVEPLRGWGGGDNPQNPKKKAFFSLKDKINEKTDPYLSGSTTKKWKNVCLPLVRPLTLDVPRARLRSRE